MTRRPCGVRGARGGAATHGTHYPKLNHDTPQLLIRHAMFRMARILARRTATRHTYCVRQRKACIVRAQEDGAGALATPASFR
jgi:hypothetical protein